MSNQEAIALLRNLEDSLDAYCELNEEGKTAFRMAIEALSCSEIPNSSDTIYRQAAIDAIDKIFPADPMRNDYTQGITCGAALAEEYIKQLPSAQQEIIYCKDCVKHNKGHGYYHDGTVIGIKDCCPLVEIRGMAQGHEFDYQYCAYAKRRTDD